MLEGGRANKSAIFQKNRRFVCSSPFQHAKKVIDISDADIDILSPATLKTCDANIHILIRVLSPATLEVEKYGFKKLPICLLLPLSACQKSYRVF